MRRKTIVLVDVVGGALTGLVIGLLAWVFASASYGPPLPAGSELYDLASAYMIGMMWLGGILGGLTGFIIGLART